MVFMVIIMNSILITTIITIIVTLTIETMHREPAPSGRGTRFHHCQIAPVRTNGNDSGGIDITVKHGTIIEVEDGVTLSHKEPDRVEGEATRFCTNVETLLNGARHVGSCEHIRSIEWDCRVAGDGSGRYVNGAGKGRLHAQGCSERLIHADGDVEGRYGEGTVSEAQPKGSVTESSMRCSSAKRRIEVGGWMGARGERTNRSVRETERRSGMKMGGWLLTEGDGTHSDPASFNPCCHCESAAKGGCWVVAME